MRNELVVSGNMARLMPQSGALRRAPRVAPEPARTWVAWLALIGLIIPAAEVQISIAGAKFTVGRLAIMLLLVPAVGVLFQKNRRFLVSDLLVCAMSAWIVGAAYHVDGTESLSSAGAEAIEFFGGYMVARAFFFGRPALQGFLSVVKIFALAAIAIAMVDTASGRLLVHHTFASLLGVAPVEDQFRMGTVRATSTFDHAILFGTFCAVVAAMLLYSETNALKRFAYTGLCFFGAFLSLSSSSLMAFAIALGTYAYDSLLRRNPWRWSVCWAALGVFALGIMMAADNPLGWILSHLTLEPASGYFRLMEWNAAFEQISQSPWTGYAFHDFGLAELYSIDTVWLALCLRFGIPAIALLFLANAAALLPTKSSNKNAVDPYLVKMRTAFSLVLVMFMFIGLTVHYWNYMWIFWGICVGIRASLREKFMAAGARVAHRYPTGSVEFANA
jgi:hypothetical protein